MRSVFRYAGGGQLQGSGDRGSAVRAWERARLRKKEPGS